MIERTLFPVAPPEDGLGPRQRDVLAAIEGSGGLTTAGGRDDAFPANGIERHQWYSELVRWVLQLHKEGEIQ